MASHTSGDWKTKIFMQLQARNKIQIQPYAEIIHSHQRLLDHSNALRTSNVQLQVEAEKLREENMAMQLRGDSGGGAAGGGAGAERLQAMEQKLFRLQEELTELHRKRGENAQQIIDLKNTLQEKEKELAERDSRIMDCNAAINSMKVAQHHMKETIVELEATNQMLKDEHQALQMVYAALENRYKATVDENADLVKRLMAIKAQDADILNEENDRNISCDEDEECENDYEVVHLDSVDAPKLGPTKMNNREKDVNMDSEEEFELVDQSTIDAIDAPKRGPIRLPLWRRQAQLKRELEEAAREPVSVVEINQTFVPNSVIMTSVPSRAQCVFDAHEGEVYSVKYSLSANKFATGGADRKVKLWEVVNGKCENKGVFIGSNAGITSVEFDLEESLLLAASNDFACRVWSVVDQRLRHTLTGHGGKVLAAKFLGDGSKVVSGSHDRTLKVWDLHSKACIKTIFAGSSCNDLVTLQSSNVLSGHFDKRVRLWDLRSDTSSNEILLQGRIASLDLAPDRTSVLCCTRDDSLKVIDLRMNQVSATLCDDNFKTGCDFARVAFSPDGDFAVAGGSDGGVYVWNVNTTKIERVLKEHTHTVYACAWSPNGTSMLSCERSKKVILWSDF